jgi:uncharacterized damage-inducible protein DinB
MSDLRYPIGKSEPRDKLSPAERTTAIEQIAAVPQRMRDAIRGLSDKQLDTPYRDGGWTVRQVVHHVPDSHLNAYIRVKLALTEDWPTIKPYDEAAWAALPDGVNTPVDTSLHMLDALHQRWTGLLQSLKPADFQRGIVHPEHKNRKLSIDWLVDMYAWHGRHHVGHITALRERMRW